MKITISFDKDSHSHIATVENPDGSAMQIAEIYGWVTGGTPSIKVPYFTPIDAIKEIENVIQREGTGSTTQNTYINIGGTDETKPVQDSHR